MYFSLKYVETPSVIYPANLTSYAVNEKKDITFTCTATGIPVPSISFWYNGHELNNTGEGLTTLGWALADRVMLGNETVFLNSSTHLYVVTQSLALFNAVDTASGNYLCLSSADIPGIGLRSANVTFSLTVYCEFYLKCRSIKTYYGAAIIAMIALVNHLQI